MARSLGFEVRITSGYRSRATQARLYRDYLNGVNLYPAAPPGTSDHERGLAIDVLSTNEPLLVELLTGAGLSWAGPEDPIHFAMLGKIASGSRQTKKVKKGKGETTLGKVLDWTAWIPGPIGWGSMIADIWL